MSTPEAYTSIETDYTDSDEVDQEDMEAMLYSQIHFDSHDTTDTGDRGEMIEDGAKQMPAGHHSFSISVTPVRPHTAAKFSDSGHTSVFGDREDGKTPRGGIMTTRTATKVLDVKRECEAFRDSEVKDDPKTSSSNLVTDDVFQLLSEPKFEIDNKPASSRKDGSVKAASQKYTPVTAHNIAAKFETPVPVVHFTEQSTTKIPGPKRTNKDHADSSESDTSKRKKKKLSQLQKKSFDMEVELGISKRTSKPVASVVSGPDTVTKPSSVTQEKTATFLKPVRSCPEFIHLGSEEPEPSQVSGAILKQLSQIVQSSQSRKGKSTQKETVIVITDTSDSSDSDSDESNSDSETNVRGHVFNERSGRVSESSSDTEESLDSSVIEEDFENVIEIPDNETDNARDNKDTEEEDSESETDTTSNSSSDDVGDEKGVSPMLDLNWNVDAADRQKIQSCEEASKKPELDDSKWQINDQDMFRNTGIASLTGLRYYTAMDVQCRNCSKRGHLSKACPEPKKQPVCCLCGDSGHLMQRCPKKLCYNCSLPGHSGSDCPKPRRSRYMECSRCWMYGHKAHECPDQWRQYHMTTHSVLKASNSVGLVRTKENKNCRIFCCNCTQKGHFEYECTKKRMDRFYLPSYPFIAEYDSVTSLTRKSRVEQRDSSRSQKRGHSEGSRLKDDRSGLAESRTYKKKKSKDSSNSVDKGHSERARSKDDRSRSAKSRRNEEKTKSKDRSAFVDKNWKLHKSQSSPSLHKSQSSPDLLQIRKSPLKLLDPASRANRVSSCLDSILNHLPRDTQGSSSLASSSSSNTERADDSFKTPKDVPRNKRKNDSRWSEDQHAPKKQWQKGKSEWQNNIQMLSVMVGSSKDGGFRRVTENKVKQTRNQADHAPVAVQPREEKRQRRRGKRSRKKSEIVPESTPTQGKQTKKMIQEKKLQAKSFEEHSSQTSGPANKTSSGLKKVPSTVQKHKRQSEVVAVQSGFRTSVQNLTVSRSFKNSQT